MDEKDKIQQAELLAGDRKKDKNRQMIINKKTSPFRLHPGGVCQDHCFYCGRKFALYDIPNHLAQLRSVEKQHNILRNEGKLTAVDCLCDACFKYIDRQANVIVDIKRSVLKTSLESNDNFKKQKTITKSNKIKYCFFPNCNKPARHSVCKKFLRKVIKKAFPSDFDLKTLTRLNPVCNKHFKAAQPHSECALCKRRLVENHINYLSKDYDQLNKLLSIQGIPVQMRKNSAVCKFCRWFKNLLQKPPRVEGQKAKFVKKYRERLIRFYAKKSANVSEEGKTKSTEKKAKKPISDIKIEQNHLENKSLVLLEKNNSDVQASKSRKIYKDKSFFVFDFSTKESITIQTSIEPPSKRKNNNIFSALGLAKQASKKQILDDENNLFYDLTMTENSIMQSSKEPQTDLKLVVPLTANHWKNDTIFSASDYEENVYGKIKSIKHHLAKRDRKLKKPIFDTEIKKTYAETKSPELLGKNNNTVHASYSQIVHKKDSIARDLTSMENITNQSSITQLSKLDTKCQMETLTDNEKVNKSRAANSNAYIAMNELSVGEKRIGIQVSIPFGISFNRTPEGWTKLQTTIHYDENTRLLWEELQKPYGNQSSFLKHLTILEKLYRHGDLTLSPNASSNASIYFKSVQNRLQSYDIIVKSKLNKSYKSYKDHVSQVLNQSNKMQQKFLNLPLTEAAKFKQTQNYQSLASQKLSNNQILLKPNSLKSNKSSSDTVKINNNCKNDYANNRKNSIGTNEKIIDNPTIPLELMTINNTLIKQSIRLPHELSVIDRIQSESWRPALVPYKQGFKQSGPSYITVDGRRLPALVPVLSEGKSYLISIHDYNRMLIIRGEKLSHERMSKRKRSSE